MGFQAGQLTSAYVFEQTTLKSQVWKFETYRIVFSQNRSLQSFTDQMHEQIQRKFKVRPGFECFPEPPDIFRYWAIPTGATCIRKSYGNQLCRYDSHLLLLACYV